MSTYRTDREELARAASSHSAPLPINPRESVLGTENAILSGTGKQYCVPDYEGCLSIKTIVLGSATWETAGRRFVVHENSYLILNDRQRYTMTIDSARKVTTFCLFFQRGFVEDVFRGTVTPATDLLDSPQLPNSFPLEFRERLDTGGNGLLGSIWTLRERILQGVTSRQGLEENFYKIAGEMVRQHKDADYVAAKLPALRPSTRQELYLRLLRGRDYLLSSLDQPIQLSDIAQAACLSPYHFHRTFTRAFGETPQRYLTRQRLEKAGRLLGQKERSVMEVCLDCGFESPSSFSSLFRRHFGVSPREFKRRTMRH